MAGDKIIKGDCLVKSDKIKSGSVDLILTDPPYGNMKGANLDGWQGNKTDWDNTLKPKEIFKIANRILKENGCLILFGQEPYTSKLINNQYKNLPFSYRMLWLKDHFANSLIAKKAPVNYFEDMLVFFKKYDINNDNELRNYAKKVKDYIGLSLSAINKKLGHRKSEHFFYITSTQFKICTKETYRELIEVFNIDKMGEFINYEDLKNKNANYERTFNLPDNKKYKSNVLEYSKDYDGYHPTQKPVALLEDLVKTYSNEGDLVVDLTAGSGSTGVACKNTNRDYILIEQEQEYIDIIEQRLKSVNCQTN